MTKHRRLLVYVHLGYMVAVCLIWMNEILDLPYYIFSSPKTPVNWVEAIINTASIGISWALTFVLARALTARIKYLEGLYIVCSYCGKIEDNKHWETIDRFLDDRSDIDLSLGICPECLKIEFPEIYEKLVEEDKILPSSSS